MSPPPCHPDRSGGTCCRSFRPGAPPPQPPCHSERAQRRGICFRKRPHHPRHALRPIKEFSPCPHDRVIPTGVEGPAVGLSRPEPHHPNHLVIPSERSDEESAFCGNPNQIVILRARAFLREPRACPERSRRGSCAQLLRPNHIVIPSERSDEESALGNAPTTLATPSGPSRNSPRVPTTVSSRPEWRNLLFVFPARSSPVSTTLSFRAVRSEARTGIGICFFNNQREVVHSTAEARQKYGEPGQRAKTLHTKTSSQT